MSEADQPRDELAFLLRSAATGDRAALEEFVARAQPDVARFCTAMIGRAHAEDATQETFLRAWRSARTFRGESTARTWLLAIARRVCADHLRKVHRNRGLEALSPTPERGEPGPLDELALTDLIRRLDPDRRSALVLTQLLGLSYEEAAQATACPVGTVRSRVARARRDIADAYRVADLQSDGNEA